VRDGMLILCPQPIGPASWPAGNLLVPGVAEVGGVLEVGGDSRNHPLVLWRLA